ncbi:MAG: hypothetical protein ACRENE_20305 [Polyangiaceae bacterium]
MNLFPFADAGSTAKDEGAEITGACCHGFMTRKRATARTVRRTQERAAVKLARDRERLAALEAGGTPSRPVEVQSAAQVEPHALAAACLRCGASNRLAEHAAVADDEGQLLRVARLRCAQCGAGRAIWFRITPRTLN